MGSAGIEDLKKALAARSAPKVREALDRLVADGISGGPADAVGAGGGGVSGNVSGSVSIGGGGGKGGGGADEVATVLAGALGHASWEIRALAGERLSAMPPAVALRPVARVLADEDPNGRYWAIQTLGALGEPGIETLAGFYPTCPADLKSFVLRAFGRVPGAKAVPLLVAALDSEDWGLREEAAEALVACRDHSIGAVRVLLNSGSANQRFWAFKILARVMGPKAIEPLTKILTSPPESGVDDTRPYALAALKEIRHPKVIDPLVKMLAAESWYLRAEAADVLAGLGSLAVDRLREQLKADSADVRFWAMKILKEILGVQALPVLAPFLASASKADRYSAVLTIGGIDDATAAQGLLRCFTDDAWIIRRTATDQVVKMGEHAIRPLIDGLGADSEEAIYWVLNALGRLKSDVAVPFVARLLAHPTKTVRLWAADCLGTIGSRRCVDELLKAMGNAQWVVRQRACDAVIRIGPMSVAPLVERITDANEDVAYWSDRALSQFGMPGLATLVPSLKRAAPDLRQRALARLRAQPLDEVLVLLRRVDLTVEDLAKLPSAAEISLSNKLVTTGVARAAEDARRRFEHGGYFDAPSHTAYPMTMDEVLVHAEKFGASDVHFKIGMPPILRINGVLTKTSFPALAPEATRSLFGAILTEAQKHKFAQDLQVDLTYEVQTGCRFRLNVYKQTKGLEAACRFIDPVIPNFKKLNLPDWVLTRVASSVDGLILVTGPTGCGKSTTIAAMVEYINRNFARHIIAIEDPIEYIHEPVLSYLSYREVGADVHNFALGLRGALREDPDVIIIGELRDRETISTALTLAGTGHLVLSTFHTFNALQTVEQVLDFFPHDQQDHLRKQFANVMRGIISQKLFLRTDGRGRIPALEILLSNNAVRNIIRDGNPQQLVTVMQSSQDEGMVTFDMSLIDLVGRRLVSYEDALPYITDTAHFKKATGAGR